MNHAPPSYYPPREYTALRTILEAAGTACTDRFRRTTGVLKADRSFVTEADKASEDILVDRLSQAFPGTGFAGEEGTLLAGDGTWYLDPLDGTHGFLEGLAHWGPTVCFARDGVLEIGAFFMPRLNEYWFAMRGKGAWRDGERLSAPPPASVGYNSTLYVPSRFHRAGRLPWPGKLRVLGSTAAHLALTADSADSACVVIGWSLWDVGCGALLLSETGGEIRNLDNEAVSLVTQQGLPILAGAPTTLEYLNRPGGLGPRLRQAMDTGSEAKNT